MPGILFAAVGIGVLFGSLFAGFWGGDSHRAARQVASVGYRPPLPPPQTAGARAPIAYKGEPLFSMTDCEWGWCAGAVHDGNGWEYDVLLPGRRIVKCKDHEVVK